MWRARRGHLGVGDDARRDRRGNCTGRGRHVARERRHSPSREGVARYVGGIGRIGRRRGCQAGNVGRGDNRQLRRRHLATAVEPGDAIGRADRARRHRADVRSGQRDDAGLAVDRRDRAAGDRRRVRRGGRRRSGRRSSRTSRRQLRSGRRSRTSRRRLRSGRRSGPGVRRQPVREQSPRPPTPPPRCRSPPARRRGSRSPSRRYRFRRRRPDW